MKHSRDPLVQRILAALRLTRDADGWLVVFDVDGDLPLGLRAHHGERDSFVRTAMRRAGGNIVQHGRATRFTIDQADDARQLAEILFERLTRIARKPVGQKAVERILAISSAERNRWTKAGLLRQSGSAEIARGGSRVTLPTYSPVAIEELAATPDTISEWRARDLEE